MIFPYSRDIKPRDKYSQCQLQIGLLAKFSGIVQSSKVHCKERTVLRIFMKQFYYLDKNLLFVRAFTKNY